MKSPNGVDTTLIPILLTETLRLERLQVLRQQ